MQCMLVKIISGGQTGVDRAALDVALELELPCGGWCPRGRRAEGGRIPRRYPLQETRSRNYSVRTARNVRESDGTLILTRARLEGGTGLTRYLAEDAGKPCHVVDFARLPDMVRAVCWLLDSQITVLNVAGPRASQVPGIYRDSHLFLHHLLPTWIEAIRDHRGLGQSTRPKRRLESFL